MHKYILLNALVALLMASSATCAGEPTRAISEAERRIWHGVAKVHVAGNRWCNGALISEREIVTVAHCLYNPLTEKFTDPKYMKVVLGQWRSEHVALLGVSALAVLPGYSPAVSRELTTDEVAFDLALLLLDSPVSAMQAQPFSLSEWRQGEPVDVIGYGRSRPYIPSIRAGFEMTPILPYVAMLNCAIEPGLSGAPVTERATTKKLPPLVGIVSASLNLPVSGDSCAALVVQIGPRLKQLRALLP
ncbi:trypsin-like serine peptidase [Ovoidimarina sediminis]|uniref:trypsin-like serine peptidase n=1 Tax=Ovoidimarina sediminis TaxID=3079856 RepID=UPI002915433C|nr:trypsin-like serine protease [Rhodophyticola sp. MJ-SS7]MDU8946771.1 trypsin-like serine protease [Rhodophyticola sp. MJ-SS7]